MEKRGTVSPKSAPFSLPALEGFRISQVQLADSGIFACVAASPAGVADRNFTLQVHGTEHGVESMGPLALGHEKHSSCGQTQQLSP